MNRLRELWVTGRSAIITGLLVALVCLPLGYCKGLRDVRVEAENTTAKANTKALTRDHQAKEEAAIEQIADEAAIDAQERTLTNAISSVPNTAPDAVRVRLGCQRLRNQGAREADLPPECRLGGNH